MQPDPADVAESCKALVKAVDNSQIVMLPGGFSGGDRPDGSAKFIASFFVRRSPRQCAVCCSSATA